MERQAAIIACTAVKAAEYVVLRFFDKKIEKRFAKEKICAIFAVPFHSNRISGA